MAVASGASMHRTIVIPQEIDMRFIRMLLLSAAIACPFAHGHADPVASYDRNDATLRATVDRVVLEQLETQHIPGATVSIVKDGKVVMTRGYGWADLEAKVPVDGETTAFRIGSLTKLFTATAVLQLSEKGLLNLDEDVQTYLGEVPLPRTYDAPVTLRQLITHTAGYDLTDIDDAVLDPKDLYSLTTLIKDHAVPQVWPPGQGHHYSNFGYAVAGLVVEKVSGMPYAVYVEREILIPLGMTHTTAAQPPSDTIRSNRAKAYKWNGSDFRELGVDYSLVAPSDVMVSSAGDMARFMIAQLEGAEGLFSESTRAVMHRQHFTVSPSPYGMAFGFEEDFRKGRRTLQHSGGQLGFSSFLFLVPEERLGVFLSVNRRYGGFRWPVIQAVLDHYIGDVPAPTASVMPDLRYVRNGEEYAGWYVPTDYIQATFEKSLFVLGLFGSGTSSVKSGGAGELVVDGETFVVVGEDLFAHPKTPHWTKKFLRDKDGKVIFQGSGRVLLQRIPWWKLKRVIQLTLIVSLLTALWSGVAWPIFRKWSRRNRTAAALSSSQLLLGRLSSVASALWAVALTALLTLIVLLSGDSLRNDYGLGWQVYTVLTILFVASIGSVVVPVTVALAWRLRWWSVGTRVVLSFQALAMMMGIDYLDYMNLLGFHF